MSVASTPLLAAPVVSDDHGEQTPANALPGPRSSNDGNLWSCWLLLWFLPPLSPPVKGHDSTDGDKLAGRNPTSATSEKNVHVHKMPWEQGAGSGKYQHLEGKDVKDAPSALNTVIVPNVNLPKVWVLHSRLGFRFRLGGVDGEWWLTMGECRICTSSLTSGVRRDFRLQFVALVALELGWDWVGGRDRVGKRGSRRGTDDILSACAWRCI